MHCHVGVTACMGKECNRPCSTCHEKPTCSVVYARAQRYQLHVLLLSPLFSTCIVSYELATHMVVPVKQAPVASLVSYDV
jgi:hypothetical protein